MKKLMCVALVLFATQSAIADYVLISGSRDNNSTKSIIRYRDTFDIIWERSEATGFADRSYNDIEVNPNDPNHGGGNLYTMRQPANSLGSAFPRDTERANWMVRAPTTQRW